MKTHIRIAWKNLLLARRQTLAIVLLSICAMTLLITGTFLGKGLREGLIRAVEPFDMLAGRGGSYQMVLNTVFLQDYPAGNISYGVVEELNRDPRVHSAIPLAFGDTYRGYRIVGVTREIFSHIPGSDEKGPWLRFSQGNAFAASSREAVVGALAAAELGLRPGDRFTSSHGLIPGGEDHGHDEYVVSGILAGCQGPYDRALFVDIRSIWEDHGMHAHVDGEDHGHHDADDNGHSTHDHGDAPQVTAIMVKPAGYAEAYQLHGDFASRSDAELMFPAGVIVRMLQVMGHADWLFKAIGGAAGAVAALTVALALYWSAASRTQEMRILRLLGAEQRDIAGILLCEGLLTLVPGLIAGCLLGHALLGLVASALRKNAALTVDWGFSTTDLALGAILLLLGLIGTVFAMVHTARKM